MTLKERENSAAYTLARRRRFADPDSAEKAAREIQAKRADLAESWMLEATVTADVLERVVATSGAPQLTGPAGRSQTAPGRERLP